MTFPPTLTLKMPIGAQPMEQEEIIDITSIENIADFRKLITIFKDNYMNLTEFKFKITERLYTIFLSNYTEIFRYRTEIELSRNKLVMLDGVKCIIEEDKEKTIDKQKVRDEINYFSKEYAGLPICLNLTDDLKKRLDL